MNLVKLQTESDVDYLRQIAVLLCNENLSLQSTIKKLKNASADDEQLRLALLEKLTILKKKYFGKSSEKGNPDRPRVDRQKKLLHNESVVPAPVDWEEITLPQDEEVHELAADSFKCGRCGSDQLREMKGQHEESCEIEVIERTYKQLRHKRQKYTCGNCEGITTAPGPLKLLPKSEYSINFAVQVATDKFSYHLPLERQRRQMENAGLPIDVKTLWTQTQHLATRLEPLVEKVRKEILAQPCAHIDETPLKLLKTDTNGYVWNLTNQYGSYFQYETTRSGGVALELLKDYEGVVLSDGYSGYKKLKRIKRERAPNLKLVYCWAHVRRKFYDAQENYPEAKEMIELIRELYELEHEARNRERLKQLREEKSSEVIVRIKSWLGENQNRFLPRSGIGKAIHYTLKLWPGLIAFVKDVNIPLDNNVVERALRASVMGRNNYHGFRTINGADVGMIFFTLIESCKLMQLNPQAYLKEMACRAVRGEALLTPYRYALEIRAPADPQ